jgi:ectoine hydroxylase-related dioxygenase (phytanoyl-CoA dioxygenase family)
MVNSVLDETADVELWTAVDDALREAGLLEMVRVFHGAVWSKLNSLAVFVNPPNQSWIGPSFRDRSAETPPTAGMHIDSNGKSYLKMILYLNEVGPEQGPTAVVPGSHEWDSGSVDRIRRRAFDRSKLLGRSMLERQHFISLPQELQVKAEFGGDLLRGSPEADALLASEFVSTGECGHYTVFNPEAVHRGGAVRSGERHALQITLGARW